MLGHTQGARAVQPIYLDVPGGAAFGIYHRPEGRLLGPGVVILPPFGWDEVCAHRSLRLWASWLATAGMATLRLTLPSTGDSAGGVRDPGRLDAWSEAVAAAVTFLREDGTATVSVIGLEMGGLVGCHAALRGTPIDDLVLWATPAGGRTLVRRLRLVAQMETEGFYSGTGGPPPIRGGDGVEAGGFTLSAETVSALEAFDTSLAPAGGLTVRRAMLIGRDGRAPDSHLHAALAEKGVEVSAHTELGIGYADMTSHPQTSVPPRAVATAVTDWLLAGPRPAAPSSAPEPAAVSDRCAMAAGEDRFTERVVTIPSGAGALSGILAEPASLKPSGVCMVLLNAGAIHRIGPNRMWVEASRRWAARGVTAFRVDLEGIGESDGDASGFRHDRAFYRPEFIEQTKLVLDGLAEDRGSSRFVIVGLCSGAFWGLHAALDDPRVAGVLLINPRALVWDASLGPSRDFRAFWARPMTSRRIVRILRSGRVLPVASWLLRQVLLRVTGRQRRQLGLSVGADVLDRVHDAAARFHFLFSADEPLLQELRDSGRLTEMTAWPNVTVSHVPVRDHTLRPLWSQEAVHTELDRMVASASGHITTV